MARLSKEVVEKAQRLCDAKRRKDPSIELSFVGQPPCLACLDAATKALRAQAERERKIAGKGG